MIKHVTEIQSITSPIFKEKFEKALADHIRLITAAIDVLASKGQVCVKIALTEHSDQYRISAAVPEADSNNIVTPNIPGIMQMNISNALAKLFTDNGYSYVSDDKLINGFNVKYIRICWYDGLVTE